MWKVYLLQEVKGNKTYVGATLDVERRLQQHNQNLSGGAKATHNSQWKRVCHITGFPNQKSALQFEWKWKNLSKKESGSALHRRVFALIVLLNSEQSTMKATDYKEYVGNLEVIWEDQRNVVDI
jgi:predicted GIY-YIG superfamily endonuclease